MVTIAIKVFASPYFHFVTLLLGFLIGHRLNIGRDERQEFNNAAAFFRDAFLPEITFLKHNTNIGNLGSSDDLGELLRFGYIHRHLKAIEVFKSNLSIKKKASIDKAWKEYCCNPNKPDELYFEQYSAKNTGKNEKEIRKLVLERIEEILKFAKHK